MASSTLSKFWIAISISSSGTSTSGTSGSTLSIASSFEHPIKNSSERRNTFKKYIFFMLFDLNVNNKNYDATLHCLPSDCQITLFDKPEVTDEEAVDLGLSVKWGNKNLGASTYTNLGNSYEDYDYDYLYNNSPELFEWNGAELNLGKTKYDYAYTDLGENWRLPTTEEWMELRDNCKWEADIIDNNPGFRVKGPNGNSIFIPGKFRYEPEGGSYAFEVDYFSSRMTSLGVRSIRIVGTKTITGFNSTLVDEYWIEDTAFIRPVCD